MRIMKKTFVTMVVAFMMSIFMASCATYDEVSYVDRPHMTVTYVDYYPDWYVGFDYHFSYVIGDVVIYSCPHIYPHYWYYNSWYYNNYYWNWRPYYSYNWYGYHHHWNHHWHHPHHPGHHNPHHNFGNSYWAYNNSLNKPNTNNVPQASVRHRPSNTAGSMSGRINNGGSNNGNGSMSRPTSSDRPTSTVSRPSNTSRPSSTTSRPSNVNTNQNRRSNTNYNVPRNSSSPVMNNPSYNRNSTPRNSYPSQNRSGNSGGRHTGPTNNGRR